MMQMHQLWVRTKQYEALKSRYRVWRGVDLADLSCFEVRRDAIYIFIKTNNRKITIKASPLRFQNKAMPFPNKKHKLLTKQLLGPRRDKTVTVDIDVPTRTGMS